MSSTCTNKYPQCSIRLLRSIDYLQFDRQQRAKFPVNFDALVGVNYAPLQAIKQIYKVGNHTETQIDTARKIYQRLKKKPLSSASSFGASYTFGCRSERNIVIAAHLYIAPLSHDKAGTQRFGLI